MIVIGVGGLLAAAAPASAHAALIESNPAPGSIVGFSPTEITVTFSEGITPVEGHVEVLAPDGKRISGAATARGAVLRIPVRKADQPLGTYLVSYRVISADSHPVGGALTFSVGAPSAQTAPPVVGGTHRSVAVAISTARYLAYAGLTFTIGPVLLLALLWPRRTSRRGAIRLTWTGLGLTAFATLAALWLQAPNSSGATLFDVSPAELGQVLTSSYGLTLIARLAVLAVVAGLLPPVLRGPAGAGRAELSRAELGRAELGRAGLSRGGVSRGGVSRGGVSRGGVSRGGVSRGRALALGVLAVGGLTTWPLTGHAVASPMSGVIVAADVVHIAAMSVWLGGLVTLSLFLLHGTHPRVLGVILPACSRWAAIAVVWLIGGGALQAVVQVGSVGALWRTEYGKLLLAKIAVLAGTLAVAAVARRLVQRAQVPAAGAAKLRRTVGIEVAATAVILGISAVLVQVNPGRSATAGRTVVSDNGVSQTLTCPLYTVQFNIYPVQLGENNTIHAFVYTPAGAPLPVEEWTVTSRLLGQNLEPVSTPLLGLIPRNHAAGAITFPLPGTYEVKYTIRVSAIDQATVNTTITVPHTPGTG